MRYSIEGGDFLEHELFHSLRVAGIDGRIKCVLSERTLLLERRDGKGMRIDLDAIHRLRHHHGDRVRSGIEGDCLGSRGGVSGERQVTDSTDPDTCAGPAWRERPKEASNLPPEPTTTEFSPHSVNNLRSPAVSPSDVDEPVLV